MFLKKITTILRKKSKQGFSLVEISVVILVIGVLLAGALSSGILVKKYRISTARSLTQASPVSSITNLSMWLEGSLEESFNDSESNEGSSLSSWYDINNSLVTKTNATQNSSNKPIFSASFNNLNAVKFDGTSNFFNFNGSSLNNSDYTIFVVEKRESNKSSNYFIGDSSITTANQNLILGYNLDGQVTHSQGTATGYSSNVSNFSNSSSEPRIFTFLHSSSLGKKTYINGILAGESPSNRTPLSNITTLTLGKNYQGLLGEVIIFSKALKNYNRQAVENYLGQKWGIKISNTSCVGGTVSSSGCAATCNVTTPGTTVAAIPQGTTTLTCDTGAGWLANSFAASCSGTTFNAGGGSCSCDTANGYTASGSSCVLSCGAATPIYVVLTSGTSYTIPSTGYYCNIKVWAIGGGGGGGGGSTSACGTSYSGGGGAGGVVYKTWSAAAGNSISYSIGTAGSSGNGGIGGNGSPTTVTFSGTTITANGGTGGKNSLSAGGSFSGGDGGAVGGAGPGMSDGSQSAAGGGAIGGVNGGNAVTATVGNQTPAGGNGGVSADVDSLFTALTAAGYNYSSNGAGGAATGNYSGRSGSSATGFGCGGGGSNYGGGTGGAGMLGGGGGGGVCTGTATNTRGGAGGSGAVVIKVY